MSRDWTPREFYLVEQWNIARGLGDKWDFMRSLTFTHEGQDPERMYSDEEIALRQQYPVIGKFLDSFCDLYDALSVFESGQDFLREKDAELSAYIATGKGDPENYLIKWFEGKLDPHFYYSERNNELFISEICKDAISRGMKNWVITDSDCMQVRRRIGFENPGVFELMQVDCLDLNGKAVYKLAAAEIDLNDYSNKERDAALRMFGYDSMKELVSATGSDVAACSHLAEILFENSAYEHYIAEFSSWNDALAEIEKRTGMELEAYREEAKLPLDEQIGMCVAQPENRDSGVPQMDKER